jgi:hypothetical protein
MKENEVISNSLINDLGKLKILSNLAKVTQLDCSRSGADSWNLNS